ncbi:MAG: hypothetical protein JRI44_02755, partial [Deltaproteobacteria bacterium]|nr:hypothetical protein [Deltaproteobacteria bacterium]
VDKKIINIAKELAIAKAEAEKERKKREEIISKLEEARKKEIELSTKLKEERLKRKEAEKFVKQEREKIARIKKEEEIKKEQIAKAKLEKEKKKKEKIKTLLAKADTLYKRSNFLNPPNDNAVTLYKKVLSIDKENIEAQDGLMKIWRYYVSRGDHFANKKEYQKALDSYNLAVKVRSGVEEVDKKIINIAKELAIAKAEAEKERKKREEIISKLEEAR